MPANVVDAVARTAVIGNPLKSNVLLSSSQKPLSKSDDEKIPPFASYGSFSMPISAPIRLASVWPVVCEAAAKAPTSAAMRTCFFFGEGMHAIHRHRRQGDNYNDHDADYHGNIAAFI